MSRYSDSSDSDVSYKKSKKKKHKRSRSRSRSKSSRKRKSRSRSRSREKRRHRSRSRDRKRSRSRDRRRSRSRTRSRDRRRSRSRDRRRSRSSSRGHRRGRARTRSNSRSESRDTSRHHPAKRGSDSDNDVEIVEDKGLNPSEMMMTISDQLKRARAISDIESDSFKQQDFKTSRKPGTVQESGDLDNDKFEFGTSIERKSKVEEDMQKLAREGLIHPGLFGDQAAREKRYLQHIWTIRQRAVQKLKG